MAWMYPTKVKAKTAAEAKRKAWQKFKNRLPKKNFEVNIDYIESGQ